MRGKRLRIIGHSVFSIPLDELAAAHAELLGHVRDGSLQLDVETTSLAEAPAAWERQKAGPHTKLVVTPRRRGRPDAAQHRHRLRYRLRAVPGRYRSKRHAVGDPRAFRDPVDGS